MIVFPALDLRDGKCVRLVQGRKEDMTVYSHDPVGMALYFVDQGARWLHIVDLDGAFQGRPCNLDKVRAIAGAVEASIQFGGGLRTREDVERALQAGASRVVIGTRAVDDPDFMRLLLQEFGPQRIVLGLDAIDGMVAVEGWEKKSSVEAVTLAQNMADLGTTTAVYTDVARDGLLQGPNLEGIARMVQFSGLQIIASGGVASLDDIGRLAGLGVAGVITGKAIYEGRLELSQAIEMAGDQSC